MSVYKLATTLTATSVYTTSMRSVDLLAATTFYVMPDSQRNSSSPNEACRHGNAYITSSYTAVHTFYTTDADYEWTFTFAQDRSIPFNVTVVDENGALYSPGSWFATDYSVFDSTKVLNLTWIVLQKPVFYETSLFIQINLKVRLFALLFRLKQTMHLCLLQNYIR